MPECGAFLRINSCQYVYFKEIKCIFFDWDGMLGTPFACCLPAIRCYGGIGEILRFTATPVQTLHATSVRAITYHIHTNTLGNTAIFTTIRRMGQAWVLRRLWIFLNANKAINLPTYLVLREAIF